MSQNKNYNIIGVMSGTSLDGLDLAWCHFEQEQNSLAYHIFKAETIPYDQTWKKRLSDSDKLSGFDLMLLHNEYGKYIGTAVKQFCSGETTRPDFIASHGHTVFHQPDKGFTLQIGNGTNIAVISGLTTIGDFRSLDVALGGQGAPLVPIGDKLLFGNYDYCLNLGGFANISYDNPEGQRIAFDICPVNIVINHLAELINLPYDKDGMLAASGMVDENLLKKLDELEYYSATGPKSLGREWVWKYFLPVVNHAQISLPDKLCTIYEHIAGQIATIATGEKTMLITGGGAHNHFLIQRIEKLSNISLTLPSKNIIDYKEALIFAFLGLLRYQSKENCLKSVTGAEQDCSGGVIYRPL